ncbi:hypothetical protein Tco_0622770 [Tanacetum coccineum]
MTRSSNKELVEPYDEPEQALHSLRKVLKTTSFDHSSSPKFELFSNYEEQVEEEITKYMTEPTMEEYMTKTRKDYGSWIARPKFNKDAKYELKGQFLKELRDNTFSGSEKEDANEHIERVLEIVNLFTTPDVTQDQLMLRVFSISLTGAARGVPIMKAYDAKNAIQEMANYSQKWHNGTSTRNNSNTSDGLATIQAQLNNLGREIKKEEGKTLEESYYTQFGVPFPNDGRYRATSPGFY